MKNLINDVCNACVFFALMSHVHTVGVTLPQGSNFSKCTLTRLSLRTVQLWNYGKTLLH